MRFIFKAILHDVIDDDAKTRKTIGVCVARRICRKGPHIVGSESYFPFFILVFNKGDLSMFLFELEPDIK